MGREVGRAGRVPSRNRLRGVSEVSRIGGSSPRGSVSGEVITASIIHSATFAGQPVFHARHQNTQTT